MSQLALNYSLDDALARDSQWSASARRWIVELPPGQTLTSDSLRANCGDPGGSGCSVGAVMNRAAATGLIRFTGESVMSVRPAARSRWIRLWQRTDR